MALNGQEYSSALHLTSRASLEFEFPPSNSGPCSISQAFKGAARSFNCVQYWHAYCLISFLPNSSLPYLGFIFSECGDGCNSQPGALPRTIKAPQTKYHYSKVLEITYLKSTPISYKSYIKQHLMVLLVFISCSVRA